MADISFGGRNEVFIGLIGPLGTDLGLLCNMLEKELQQVNCKSFPIRLSSILSELSGFSISASSESERIDGLIAAGNELRKTLEMPEAFAALSIPKVQSIREEEEEKEKDTSVSTSKKAFIFRSCKRPEEVEFYRKVYDSSFFLIAAYAPRNRRVDHLANSLASDAHSRSVDTFRAEAERLISTDEDQAGAKYGQRVRKAFPMADAFFDVTEQNKLKKEVERFVGLLFGNPFLTPTKSENAMFHASGASLRSAALGRQVGAAIVADDGYVVSLGTNEVPRPLGGSYWPEDSDDMRDFQCGFDSNDFSTKEVLAELVHRLMVADCFNEELAKLSKEDRLAKIERILNKAQIMDLIEFYRPVHAEMTAIMDAARRGVSVSGCSLYSTTFPCHECTRHIIAAGIKEVLYIEPYPKSRAYQLHSDAIVIDPVNSVPNKVIFRPFVGISPNRYIELFSMSKRKEEDGKIKNWEGANESPKTSNYQLSYRHMEHTVATTISNILRDHKLIETESGREDMQ